MLIPPFSPAFSAASISPPKRREYFSEKDYLSAVRGGELFCLFSLMKNSSDYSEWERLVAITSKDTCLQSSSLMNVIFTLYRILERREEDKKISVLNKFKTGTYGLNFDLLFFKNIIKNEHKLSRSFSEELSVWTQKRKVLKLLSFYVNINNKKDT